jgi:glycosyltransferase involved in cell wall biosynthesis
LRIALLSETYSRKMGYLENMLPKHLARLGADVHVLTTDLPPYYWDADFRKTYGGFSDNSGMKPGMAEQVDGCTLNVLAHRRVFGQVRMAELGKKLAVFRPEIVQTMTPYGWIAMDAALYQARLGYKLFTGCHYHSSVFPLANGRAKPFSVEGLKCLLGRTIPGRLVSFAVEKCYAISADCADVARRFFGVPSPKISVCSLGVDTDLFHPPSSEADKRQAQQLRCHLGFREEEIVCIYTGRLTSDKNPLLLAKAVSRLRRAGMQYRGLFVGNGPQSTDISEQDGCVVHPFVPVQELGSLYRAADVGVWPTQESLSMMDGAACGIPIIANDSMTLVERIEGNGLTYRLNDLDDLVRVLETLGDSRKRSEMGALGARKMARDFSWESVARKRLVDYTAAIRSGGFQNVSRERIAR